MEETLKINVPDGYEIDKEKSTFENIVFKKKDDVVIKWNKQYGSVDIIADGEKFRIDAMHPSFVCSWVEAIRYFDNMLWTIPTVKQLQVLDKYINNVNAIIQENGGFKIYGPLWSCEEKDDFCAWTVSMDDGTTYNADKNRTSCVRAVSAF